MITHLSHQNHKKIPTHAIESGVDDCSSCTQKLCCRIFTIVAEENQGRREEVIKDGGKTCDHLQENGECGIYHEREKYKGYAKSCKNFTCSGVGPLLDGWILEKGIDLKQNSQKLSGIFESMIFSIKNRKNTHPDLEKFLSESNTIDGLITSLYKE